MKKYKINIKRWAFTFFLAMFGMLTFAQTTPTTNLSAYEPNDVPAGATFEWHVGADASSDFVTAPEAVAPGLYFGFYNYGEGCYSLPTPIRIMTNVCPEETVNLNDAVSAAPSGAELSFHSAVPIEDANALSTAQIEAAGQGSYYVAYKTIVSGASCYSKANLIVMVPTDCTPNTTDAINDINNTFVNVPVPGNVLTNDEDAEGNAQTVTSNTQPANGSVTVQPDGSYVYTPNADFVGEDTFTYTIVDDGNPEATDVATVVITILPNQEGNNPPVANDDTSTTPLDTPVIISTLPNDFDPDGDIITVTPGSVTDPSNGAVVLNPNGTVTYTPEDGFVGEDTFTYQICDNGNPALCDMATVTVTVLPETEENDTFANDDAYNGDQDTDILGSVLDNDTDAEGDDQTVNTTPVVDPTNGTVVLNSDGTFVYTPNPGYTGPDSFVYNVCDNGSPSACDEATVVLTIKPVGVCDLAQTNPIYLAGDCDGDGVTNGDELNPPSGEPATDPTNPCDFNSADITVAVSGAYLVADCDGDGVTNGDELNPPSGEPATDPTNPCDFNAADITVAVSGAYLVGDCDGDGVTNGDELNPPSGEPATDPTNPCDFNSADITVAVSGAYLVADCDGDGVTNGDELNPQDGEEPTNPNDPCDFITADISLSQTATYLDGDCDGDGVTNGDELNPQDGEEPTNPNDPCDFITADISLSQTAAYLDGDCDGDGVTNGDELNPQDGEEPTNPNDPCDFITADISLSQTAAYLDGDCDGDGVTNGDELNPQDGEEPTNPNDPCDYIESDITLAVTANVVCNTTKANDDELSTEFETPVSGNVLTNDTDEEGDNVTVNTTPVVSPENGTVVLNSDGTFTYTPNDGFEGEDSFVYSKCDDGTPVACDEATATITVGEKPNTTKANDDELSTEFETPVSGNVLTNDTDAEGDNVTVNTTPVVSPENGTVVLNSDGTFTYTPNDGFEGEDSFVYSKCDDGTPVACDEATATITVGEKPNTTKANDDELSTEFETPVSGNVLTNDTDEEGDNVTVNTTPVVSPENGTVVLNSDGTFTYTPNDGFEGEDSFVYSKCDDGTPVACDEATATITVGEKPNTTKANDDELSTEFETPVSGNVLTNDTDAEGDNVTVNTTPVVSPENGTVVLNSDGTFTYTPNDGFEGEDSFVYSKCDDGTPVACDEATATITVGEKPNTTKANDDELSTEFETPVSGNVLTNDTDAEGDNVTVNTTPVVSPENGTVVLNSDGTFTYTPNDGFEGEDSFVYSKCDDGTPVACDEATATITVGEKPNTTKANDDELSTEFETPVDGNVLTNDTDEEGDNVTVNTTPVVSPENGTVVLNSDGTFTYTPNDGFEGEDSFVYSKCDDGTPVACDEATATITVGEKPNTTKANDDELSTEFETPVDGNVLTNDTDEEGDNVTVNTTPVVAPENGTVVLNEDGTFTYTPNDGFEGEDSFVYSKCDDGTPVACDEATATIIVGEKPNSTVAVDDELSTEFETPVDGNVLTNDTDEEGDNVTVNTTPVVAPENGTVVLNEDGTFTYTPNDGFEGEDSFVYSKCDDGTPVACDEATVTITVSAAGDTDGDGDPDNTDPNPTDPCVYGAGQVYANATAAFLGGDCDGDGVTNGDEIDPNGDGTPGGVGPNGPATDPQDPCSLNLADVSVEATSTGDCDGDGVSNADEINSLDPTTDPQSDPTDPCDYNVAEQGTPSAAWDAADCDGDGVTNGDEIDPDGDGTPGGVGPNGPATDPQDPCSLNLADVSVEATSTGDCDGDGVSNADEINSLDPTTDPQTDPTDPCDYNVAEQGTPSAAWDAADCDGDGNPNGTDPNPLVPVANDDAFVAPFGETTYFDILENDDFLANDGNIVTVVPGGTANGQISYKSSTGEYGYTPTADEVGTVVTVIYQVCQGNVCDQATVTITVTEPSDHDCDGDGDPDYSDPAPLDPCVYGSGQVLANAVADFFNADCDGDGVTNGDELHSPNGKPATDIQNPCSFNPIDITLDVTSTITCPTISVCDFVAYPVPVVTTLNIKYSAPYDTSVVIEIFDTKGTCIARYTMANYLKGAEEIAEFDLSHIDEGVLFVRLSTERETLTKQIVKSKN